MFRKMIYRLIKWAAAHGGDAPPEYASKSTSIGAGSHPRNFEDSNRGMNFSVYNATGGKVVQLYSYDVRTDKTISNLYIIHDKEDLGEELSLIITRESLSR